MTALEVVVTGHVQGVGYRDFVRRTAVIFGVRGEVWNRPDGAVEMVLEHEDEPHLRAFVKMLPEGPGRVEAVDVEVTEAEAFDGFKIAPSR